MNHLDKAAAIIEKKDREISQLKSEMNLLHMAGDISEARAVERDRAEAKLTEANAEIARLKEKVISIIDRSGIEDIYNWGFPLREIRQALNPEKPGGGE